MMIIVPLVARVFLVFRRKRKPSPFSGEGNKCGGFRNIRLPDVIISI